MDFETTSLSGSQLLQQFQSTLAQYAPDYAEEAPQYEQAKDSLPEVIRLEKLIHTAYEDFSPAQQEAAAQIGDYYAYLETVGFKIMHYWGFLWGNAFYSQVIPGYAPDSSFTSQYAHMIEWDLGIVIQQK